MEHSFLVIDGDKRQSALYNYLLNKHLVCSFVKTDDIDFENKIKSHSVIICPTPFKDYKIINLLLPKQILVGYGLKDEFTTLLNKKNINYIDLAQNDYFLWNNGYLTAEALIGTIITTIPFSIPESQCLICGYGNCGTHIATLLSRLGGNITIYDKVNSSQLKACSTNYSSINKLDFRLSNFDIIINTVPYNIFTLDNVIYISNNCYVFDIASPPYGFDSKYRNTSSRYFLLPGLPGKIMPKSAGELIGKTILNIVNKKEQSYEV